MVFDKRHQKDGSDFKPAVTLRDILAAYHTCCQADGYLYVHCEMGRSRSVTAVIMLMATLLWLPALTAKHCVQRHRHIGEITEGCMELLQSWALGHDATLTVQERACTQWPLPQPGPAPAPPLVVGPAPTPSTTQTLRGGTNSDASILRREAMGGPAEELR